MKEGERGRETDQTKKDKNKEVRWKRDKTDHTQVNKEQQQVKIWAMTLAGVVGIQVVSRPAGAVVAVCGVGAALAAASVVLAAALAAAELPRLVLKVAAIVDEVADALQRQAGPPIPAIELCHRVAGDGGSRLLVPYEENGVCFTYREIFPASPPSTHLFALFP